MMTRVVWIVCLLITGMACNVTYAQERKMVKEGNKLYENKDYKAAAEAYQKALQKNPSYTPGLFNLGNSLYQQKQFEQARKVLDATAKSSKEKDGKAAANYNIGNTYMQEQKWQEAVDAYKKALRNNPQDADAKYNLSYALSKLKQEQNGGGGKDNKDQDKKDDKKDNKDNKDQNKDQNKDNKDQKGDDKKEQDKQDDKQDQQDKKEGDKDKGERPQPQPSKLTEQQADQLLNALQQEEKKLQDKMQKEKGIPLKVEKDW